MANQLSGHARTAALFAQAGRSLAWAAEEIDKATLLDPMPLPDESRALARAAELSTAACELLDDAAEAVSRGATSGAADLAAKAADVLHDAAVLAAQGEPLMRQSGSRLVKVGDLLHEESAWVAGAAEALRAGKAVA